jgi:hypothetical protein
VKAVRRLFLGGVLLAVSMAWSTPALAQIDFSGEWASRFHEDFRDRGPGPMLGDYLELPINEAGRLRAESWQSSSWGQREWMCRPNSVPFHWRQPMPIRISKVVDPVTREIVAFRQTWLRNVDNVIYLDGRPHPDDDAPHTWLGFSTGLWEGDVLKVTITHLKENLLERIGVFYSDRATQTEYWVRHGDLLTITTILTDPVYLTEPFIWSTDFVLDLNGYVAPYPCDSVDEVDMPKGFVPHNLPGSVSYVAEFAKAAGLPEALAHGGAETMYPDFLRRLNAPNGAAMPPVVPPRMVAAGAAPAATPRPPGGVRVRLVRGNVYMIAGAGGNITASVGPDGVLLVDAGSGQLSDDVLTAIRNIQNDVAARTPPEPVFGTQSRSTLMREVAPPPPPKPIRFIVNTSVDPQHTGGNTSIAAAGRTISSSGGPGNALANPTDGAAIIAHENILTRMSRPAAGAPAPTRAQPTDVYISDGMKLGFFNGEGVQVLRVPAAYTDGDSIVYFRYSDVISTGDIFLNTGYPVIDLEKGGTLQGIIDGLNHVLDIAIAEYRSEGGTMIVPGHGRVTDSSDVAYYRDMLTVIRDRVSDLIKKGMTLEQVKAARPTLDYDGRWGSTTGPWTTEQFVEAVYRSLAGGAR